MRKRLRKKRHRQYLVSICSDAVTSDAALRDRLLQSEPGTPFEIEGQYSERVSRTIKVNRLRYWVTVAYKLGPTTAVVVYWAEEFPVIHDEAVIFSFADLDLSHLLTKR